MKKFFLSFFVGLLAIFNFQVAFAGPSIDQQHTEGTGSLAISTGQIMAQRFQPTMSGLSKVEIELTNVGTSQKVSVAIKEYINNVLQEANLAEVKDQTAINGWNTFDFEDIDVTIEGAYGIFVTASYGPQWKYKGGPSVYTRGYAIWQDEHKVDWDFNFKTWGTDPVEMVDGTPTSTPVTPQPKTTASTQPSSTDTTSTAKAPAATTSSAIKAPSELVLVNNPLDGEPAIKATWTPSSSTDIEGYKIFRSEDEKENFEAIGSVEKTILEFVDRSVEAEKTYFYFVRAYKGELESASTDTVSIKAETVTAQDLSEATKSTEEANSSSGFDWKIFVLVIILLGLIGFLVYYELKIKPKKITNKI